MNCEECEERVLDLIEQEPRDPEAVRSLLERCPDCRVRFDEMKALLDQVSGLTIEEPSPATDRAIVAAALDRVESRRRPRRWILRPPPWAAAAVALLAVGVGVWAIPRMADRSPGARIDLPAGDELERSEAAGRALEDDDSIAAPSPATTLAEAPLHAEAELGGEAAAPAPRRKRAASTRSASDTELVLAEAERVRSSRPSADAAATADTARSEGLRCERRRLDIESQDRAVTAEEALWLGSCYREAGDWRRARRWFERAASDPATRARATRALETLPTE